MYDYKEGKKRIQEIITNKLKIEKGQEIPTDDHFTYENAYYGPVGAIFVDIRNSTQLFAHENKEEMSKVIRCFSSEIIEILRDTDQLREIGVRGDCVYAIYTVPWKINIDMMCNKAFVINTFLKMLNSVLKENNFPICKAGIGISYSEDLVVKAGRKGTGINNTVWIGKAATHASKLSSLANKGNINPIAMTPSVYNNLIREKNKDYIIENWFEYGYDFEIGGFHHCDIIQDDFNQWIEGGMK